VRKNPRSGPSLRGGGGPTAPAGRRRLLVLFLRPRRRVSVIPVNITCGSARKTSGAARFAIIFRVVNAVVVITEPGA
jgi:hypothetical protein